MINWVTDQNNLLPLNLTLKGHLKLIKSIIQIKEIQVSQMFQKLIVMESLLLEIQARKTVWKATMVWLNQIGLNIH